MCRCQEEMAATQQQYFKLRHELLNNVSSSKFVLTVICQKLDSLN